MQNTWGIIGAGAFADRVFAPAIHAARDARLVAVMARNNLKAEAFAKTHGAERHYETVDDLCGDDDVEMVYISSPTTLHCEHTLAAARRGKHVLCEKPMAPTLTECDRMIQACADNEVTLAIGHNMRFHRIHQEVRSIVADRRLGAVGLVRAEMITSFRKNQGERFRTDQFRLNRGTPGGGVMFDMGIHTIDLLRFVVGEELEEVTAFSQNLFTDCDGEDTVSAVFRFRNGVHGSVTTSGAIPYARNGIDVYGERGTACTSESVWINAHSGKLIVSVDDKSEVVDIVPNNCYIAEVEHFQECVAQKRKPWVDGEEARKNIEVVLAIYRSMDEKRTVVVGR